MLFKKLAFIFIIQIFFCAVCFAQTPTIDSLKNILPSLRDAVRIDCLNELGFEFSDRYWSKSKYQQTDTALLYTLQAQNEAQRLHYLRGIGKALQNLGTIEEEHGNFTAAENYIRKALPVLEKENMHYDYHRALVLLGWILQNRGFFAQSITLNKKELPYYEAIKDSEHIAAIYRIIARAYDAMGNSGDAFTYFQKDFAIQKNPADAWGKRSTATLKAAVYMAAGDTANAALYYKQAAAFSINQHAMVEAYHLNMAIAYSLQKKYDSALLEMRSSINKIKSSNADSLFRKPALMRSYITLTDLFLSLKQFDSAIIYCEEPLSFFKNGDCIAALMPMLKTVAAAYHEKHQNDYAFRYTNQLLFYAQRAGARKFERDGYKLLWEIYRDQHKATLADTYQLKYILLNDSLQNDKYISQAAAWQAISDLNIKEANYKNQLKINEEHNNAKVELISNEKKNQLYIFIAAIAFISLLTILIIGTNRLKRKKDQLQLMMVEANISLEKQKRQQEVTQLQQQKIELEMQALRAQMNPHFIFNSLNSINRFILKKQSSEATEYLTKFSRLIRMILNSSANTSVSLTEDIEALKLYLELESLRFEEKFNYNIQYEPDLDIDFIQVPPMLLQPYIENAIWHGIMHKAGKGHLDIMISQKNNMLCCKITDDGVGRKEALALKSRSAVNYKSMGMRITADRIAMLHRQYKTENAVVVNDLILPNGNPGGTEVIIKIPLRYD